MFPFQGLTGPGEEVRNGKPKETRVQEKGLEGVPAAGLRKKLEENWDQTPDRASRVKGLRVRKGRVGLGEPGATPHGGDAGSHHCPGEAPPARRAQGAPQPPTKSTCSSTM